MEKRKLNHCKSRNTEQAKWTETLAPKGTESDHSGSDYIMGNGQVRQEATPGIAAMPFLPFGMILLWHASPVMRRCEAHKTMWKTLKVIFG